VHRRSVILVLLSVVLAAGPGTAQASTSAAQPTPGAPGAPGAPGIGDPYYPLDGNGGYDVLRYDLDLTYTPATDLLVGVAMLAARATQDLSSFNLDFQGLTVRAVTVDGRAATWRRAGGELTVVPSRALRDDRRFAVTVVYDGVPQTLEDDFGFSGFFHTDDGALAVGQPDVAATWFPANDHPVDAARFDIRITVPAGVEAISNGTLVRSRTRDGASTWEWRAREPMATYLVVLAIGQFDLQQYQERAGQSQRPIRFLDAIDPDLFRAPGGGPSRGDTATAALALQPEILDVLSGFFGPYPFRDAGGIVDDDERLQFALETQTRPIYAPLFFDDAELAEIVVVHELAHMWFGDAARLQAWQHIWLNEGFATYAEWLWLEQQGTTTAQEIFDDLLTRPATDPLWASRVGNPGPAVSDLFGEAVYVRGAMTLHALRLAIGDGDFFRLLQRWASTQSGGTVTTTEFITMAEQVSGQQLDALFQRWLFTPSRPTV
jgi:aminopeptidase N